MIKITRKIEEIFKSLYESEKVSISTYQTFDEVMESNESRIKYLIGLFEKIENDELSEDCKKIFTENMEFLHSFITGDLNEEFTVPNRFFNDKEECLIIPNDADIEYLIKLIKANKEMFELLYENKGIIIELPKKTFHQNMRRILEIQEYNLAHLLGITESEPTPDPSKNVLKKYFMNNVDNTEKYGEKISERLLNWILSEEGKNEIRKLNKITHDFVFEDKMKNPNTYDEKGNIKPKALEKFKNRFKQTTGFEYPIIKFSRYITKCINTLNFLNMNNVNRIILDYNAPLGKTDEKDIFIINSSTKLMSKETEEYIQINNDIFELITKYATNKENEKIKEELDKLGINIFDKDIAEFINLIQTNAFVGKHNINPSSAVALEKIRTIISKKFNKNIHLLGFDTELNGDTFDLDTRTTNYSHCDTSISLTISELIGEFYERGRVFFLDKIYDPSGTNLIRISSPKEEIEFLEQMSLIYQKESKKESSLKQKLLEFEKKYLKFKTTYVLNKKDDKNLTNEYLDKKNLSKELTNNDSKLKLDEIIMEEELNNSNPKNKLDKIDGEDKNIDLDGITISK